MYFRLMAVIIDYLITRRRRASAHVPLCCWTPKMWRLPLKLLRRQQFKICNPIYRCFWYRVRILIAGCTRLNFHITTRVLAKKNVATFFRTSFSKIFSNFLSNFFQLHFQTFFQTFCQLFPTFPCELLRTFCAIFFLEPFNLAYLTSDSRFDLGNDFRR